MAANDLTFEQVATILTAIADQATGTSNIVPTDTASFMTLATTTLKTGYDPILNAISCVMNETIFSVRPYQMKFKLITRDKSTYGMHSRKINYIDKPISDDDAYDATTIVDGSSIDHYTINKPKVIQTNFYGEDAFKDYITIFENQIDVAFTGFEQFREFISGVLQNIDDKLTQVLEGGNRATLLNMVGGTLALNGSNVIHLITEYQNDTGNTTITQSNYKSEAEFPYFAKWVVARIEQISNLMTERSLMFHSSFTGAPIMRHTPKELQRGMFYSPMLTFMRTNMLADAFNEGDLELVPHEMVNYWQSIDSPSSIDVRPSWLDATGAVTELDVGDPDITTDYLFGVLFDVDALGSTLFNERMASTPLNASGLYTNLYFHHLRRWWNDYSENFVVFLMD